ncbi:uncharacterized protein AB675_3111 [Cyphellophora attinorum]|uniref:Uncharacterized protein n=1 Tax=Cyphellophora attinorum TaxID=1664694 RepID=A0A0N1H1F5_9EURO|nr:uncharacterized protein AB675_3111 [Phialophora attinorum]KPI37926.1 hypothetical protein AB675_3111 [Phialophora attinorum]
MDVVGQGCPTPGPSPGFLMPPPAWNDFGPLGVRCVPGDQHPNFREAARVVCDYDSDIFERLEYLALANLPIRLELSPGQFLNVCFSQSIWSRLREQRGETLDPGNDGDQDMSGSESVSARCVQSRSGLLARLHPLQSPTLMLPDPSRSPTSASSDNAEASSRGRSPSVASQGSDMNSIPRTRRAKSFTGRVYRCPVPERDCKHAAFSRLQNCKNHVVREHSWFIENHPHWEMQIQNHSDAQRRGPTSPLSAPHTPAQEYLSGHAAAGPSFASSAVGLPAEFIVHGIPRLQIDDTHVISEQRNTRGRLRSRSEATPQQRIAAVSQPPGDKYGLAETYGALQHVWDKEFENFVNWNGFQGG